MKKYPKMLLALLIILHITARPLYAQPDQDHANEENIKHKSFMHELGEMVSNTANRILSLSPLRKEVTTFGSEQIQAMLKKLEEGNNFSNRTSQERRDNDSETTDEEERFFTPSETPCEDKSMSLFLEETIENADTSSKKYSSMMQKIENTNDKPPDYVEINPCVLKETDLSDDVSGEKYDELIVVMDNASQLDRLRNEQLQSSSAESKQKIFKKFILVSPTHTSEPDLITDCESEEEEDFLRTPKRRQDEGDISISEYDGIKKIKVSPPDFSEIKNGHFNTQKYEQEKNTFKVENSNTKDQTSALSTELSRTKENLHVEGTEQKKKKKIKHISTNRCNLATLSRKNESMTKKNYEKNDLRQMKDMPNSKSNQKGIELTHFNLEQAKDMPNSKSNQKELKSNPLNLEQAKDTPNSKSNQKELKSNPLNLEQAKDMPNSKSNQKELKSNPLNLEQAKDTPNFKSNHKFLSTHKGEDITEIKKSENDAYRPFCPTEEIIHTFDQPFTANSKIVYEETLKEKNPTVPIVFSLSKNADISKRTVEIFMQQEIIKSLKKLSHDIPIQRGMFVDWLVKALDLHLKKESESFKDVASHHLYSKSIAIAKSLGIVKGFQNKFESERIITREEMVVLISRSISTMKGNKIISHKKFEKFSDYKTVSQYARKSFANLLGLGIIDTFEGKVLPKKVVRCAEAINAIEKLMNFCQ